MWRAVVAAPSLLRATALRTFSIRGGGGPAAALTYVLSTFSWRHSLLAACGDDGRAFHRQLGDGCLTARRRWRFGASRTVSGTVPGLQRRGAAAAWRLARKQNNFVELPRSASMLDLGGKELRAWRIFVRLYIIFRWQQAGRIYRHCGTFLSPSTVRQKHGATCGCAAYGTAALADAGGEHGGLAWRLSRSAYAQRNGTAARIVACCLCNTYRTRTKSLLLTFGTFQNSKRCSYRGGGMTSIMPRGCDIMPAGAITLSLLRHMPSA